LIVPLPPRRRRQLGAAAKAAAFVSKADVAAAAALAAASKAVAASLQHLTGLAVDTRDAATVFGALVLALAAAQIEAADLLLVAHAAAGALVFANRLAEGL
jgi:hypothetical protein